MKYTKAQIEKLLIERDMMKDQPSSELTHRNKELMDVLLTDTDTYHKAAISVYSEEEVA